MAVCLFACTLALLSCPLIKIQNSSTTLAQIVDITDWCPLRDETGSPCHVSQRFRPGRVGSRVNVSDPVFDPVLSFNMRVYRGVVTVE